MLDSKITDSWILDNKNMIQPEFKSLIVILTDKLFRIPEYQRHYSWQPKQRNELFEDIKKLQAAREKYDERLHFMATVVCLKTKDRPPQVGSNTFYIYDIVDGQQRLTTLVILLKALSLKLRAEVQLNEANELDKLLVKDDGKLIILQNNHDNRFIIRNYLSNGQKPEAKDIKTVADRNLSEAIKDCEKFVSSYANSVNLLALVKNHLYFIFHSLEDKGAVYTIFEVLNSRGLDVDWLDKCKSLLMGLLYESTSSPESDTLFSQHLNELHSYWSEIYRQIGLQNIPGHEIIRFAATLKKESDAGRPLSAEDALDFFKDDCKALSNDLMINKIIENTVLLKEITSCLSKLYTDKRRTAVTDITQARLLAVAIMLRKDLREEERNKLLEQWERTSFKIYGLFRKDSRTKVGDYVRVAKKIRKDASASISDLLRSIADIGRDFAINTAVEELQKPDFYSDWQKELRYFFFRYEEHLSKTNSSQMQQVIWEEIWKSNVNGTIEHILPQDKSKPCWDHFTEDEHKEFLHSIGNLCLLSPCLNSQAGNKCFSDKKEIYKKAKLMLLDEVRLDNGVERNVWDKDAIKYRTEQLIKFTMEQWKDL